MNNCTTVTISFSCLNLISLQMVGVVGCNYFCLTFDLRTETSVHCVKIASPLNKTSSVSGGIVDITTRHHRMTTIHVDIRTYSLA